METPVAFVDDKPRPRDDIHENPWLTLLYLAFVFVPLVFYPGAAGWPLWASVLAILVFLPLHFRFYRVAPPARPPLVLAVALIGYALVPFNAGGQTFLVYACAMAGWSFRPRLATAVAGLLLAILVAEFFLVMPNLRLALAWTGMAVLVAAMVFTGTLFSRHKARRDAELRLTQDEVGRLAAMAERERIGRDLHDLLGHTLSLVALKSELAGRLIDRDPAAAKAQIGEVETVARQALAQVREAVIGIRATGLQAELAAARLALLSADVRLDHRLAPVALSPATESVLAMALREAVTNVLRHASANRVEVELARRADRLCLSIADDGRGGALTPGNGLAGMRERLATVGGTLDIDSPAGAGTRLLLSLPASAIEGASP
jgi:two-component system sensor histidine kinase DesK